MLPRCGLRASARLEWGSLEGGGADEDGGGTALWRIAPSEPEGHRCAARHRRRGSVGPVGGGSTSLHLAHPDSYEDRARRGWFNGLFRPDSTALDRAALPERERQSLSQQMGVPLEQVPHDYGEYFDFLKKMGVEIYGNRTMMLLYRIDPARVASSVTPIPLDRMVQLFDSADRIIVY